MIQARRWWPGLVLVALMWLLAVWGNVLDVETGMVERARGALKDSLLADIKLSAAGRDVSLDASAFSSSGAQSAVQAIEAAPGIRLVRDLTRLVPEASPFTWSARREVTGVTLTGHVPLPATRAKLVEMARSAGANSDPADQMAFARGNLPRFDTVALLLIEQLGRMKSGEVRVSGGQIEVQGVARELGGREAIVAALRGLPQGFSIKAVNVEAPPFVFRAQKDPVAGTVTLSGNVPDAAARVALVSEATRRVHGGRIIDELKTAEGAPANFTVAAQAGLGQLARLSTGLLTLSDRQVTLSGDALYEAAADQIRNLLPSDLPAGFQAKAEITVRPASAQVDITICQQIFTDTLTRNRIRFQTGSAEISPESTALLDRLVEIAMRCPSAKIDIEGHTDSDGDAQANMALSQARAQAVADFLVKAGLPPDRINATGYGPTRPIASNDTPEGKASNRRIEFHLR